MKAKIRDEAWHNLGLKMIAELNLKVRKGEESKSRLDCTGHL